MKTGYTLLVILSMQLVPTYGWELKKDKDGIKVYTQEQAGSKFIKYRVVTEIDAPMKRIYEQAVDFQYNKQFLSAVRSVNIENYEADAFYQIYMILDMPWPIQDRYLQSRMEIKFTDDAIFLDSYNQKRANPDDNYIAIQDFKESWIITANESGNSIVTITGFADPGGSLPAWVVNMFVVDEPFSFMQGIKTTVEQQ